MKLHSKEKTMSKETYTIDFTNVKYDLEMLQEKYQKSELRLALCLY